MYNSEISSNLLFHFTPKVEFLVSILDKGFFPRTAKEDISFMLPNYPSCKVGIPMVCFTDIPFELSEPHRQEYGSFGIGLKKEWGINNGLNPVNYIIKNSEMYKAYNHLQFIASENAKKLDEIKLGKSVESGTPGENTLQMMVDFMNYAGFLKEYSSDPTLESKPYYDEREWRYLPPFTDNVPSENGYCNRLLPEDVDDSIAKQKLDKHMEEVYPLKFTLTDIETIVVPDESIEDFKIELCKHHMNMEDYLSKIPHEK